MAREPRPHDLLTWYIDAGADEAIGDQPKDRFTEPEGKTPPAPQAKAPPARAASMPPAAAGAFEIAAGCQTLDELVTAIEAFDGCALKDTATNTVIYDGNPNARVVFVGEAPGGEEDRQGLPFVGPAGRLLDRMLAAIGLDRESVLITNILFWRPPGNRSPTADEITTCLPFARRLIELVAPKMLVSVGGVSAKALLERSEGITRLRGVWHDYSSPGLAAPVAAMAMFHSAYLLRQPMQKREAWRDLLAIKARLAENGQG